MADWFYVPSWKRMPITPPFLTSRYEALPRNTDHGGSAADFPNEAEPHSCVTRQSLVTRFDAERPGGVPTQSAGTSSSEKFLLFLDECGLGETLAERLQHAGHDVVTIKTGETFAKVNENEYLFNPAQYGDYNLLFRELANSGKIPSAIVHLWSVTADTQSRSGLENLDKATDAGFSSLVFMVQAIAKQHITQQIDISVISNHLHEVIGGELLCPEKATVLGPVKVIPQEYPNIHCRNIDIEVSKLSSRYEALPRNADHSGSAAGSPLQNEAEPHSCVTRQSLVTRTAATDDLLTEILTKSAEPVVALRGNHRWVQCFEPVRIDKPSEESASRFREKGVYLITGGMGGIGFVIAKHLAKTVKARLILTGRSVFPDRDTWDEWLSAHEENDPVRVKILKIKELEAAGADVLVINADVSDEEQMREALVLAEKRFGAINGVVHTAGLADYEGVIQRRTKEAAERVLLPKVKGALVLDSVFKEHKLDFFILFSSLTSVTGGFGQADYCATNAFLDAFAYLKSAEGTSAVSVNWDIWQEVGMTVEAVKQWTGRLHASGMNKKAAASAEDFLKDGLHPSEGAEVFNRILEACLLPRIAVSTQDLTILLKQDIVTVSPLPEYSDESMLSEPRTERPGLSNMHVAPRNQTDRILADIWQNLLGIKQVGIYDNFFELGGHSLMGIQLLSRLHDAFQIELSLQTLFDKPTIADLTDIIEKRCQTLPDDMKNILKILDIKE